MFNNVLPYDAYCGGAWLARVGFFQQLGGMPAAYVGYEGAEDEFCRRVAVVSFRVGGWGGSGGGECQGVWVGWGGSGGGGESVGGSQAGLVRAVGGGCGVQRAECNLCSPYNSRVLATLGSMLCCCSPLPQVGGGGIPRAQPGRGRFTVVEDAALQQLAAGSREQNMRLFKSRWAAFLQRGGEGMRA